MDVSDYIGFVASEGELFASAAEQGDLNVEIAPCPGWDMRELVRHLGMIHLWAAANVAFPESDWLDVSDLPDLVRYWPELTGESGEYPDDAELVDWYRDTLANLIEVLKSAPADVAAFTFLPAPSPLSMWARRQASEIAIHRFDAEHAAASPPTSTPRSPPTCSTNCCQGSPHDLAMASPSTASGSSTSTPRTSTNTGT